MRSTVPALEISNQLCVKGVSYSKNIIGFLEADLLYLDLEQSNRKKKTVPGIPAEQKHMITLTPLRVPWSPFAVSSTVLVKFGLTKASFLPRASRGNSSHFTHSSPASASAVLTNPTFPLASLPRIPSTASPDLMSRASGWMPSWLSRMMVHSLSAALACDQTVQQRRGGS
ncbi:hypothetical protein BC826DRAFT_147794 [Russula brevipes]|nr:hypothetical protein BC826DRAFT_147794 [Russula brevipes]